MNALPNQTRQIENLQANKYQTNLAAYVKSESYTIEENISGDPFWKNVKLGSAKNQRIDTESVASSTHFTVVNGFTRHNKSSKGDRQMWCCKSSHQITVLVVTMTILFTAGILAAICYVESEYMNNLKSKEILMELFRFSASTERRRI
jgi:hypothetical protein